MGIAHSWGAAYVGLAGYVEFADGHYQIMCATRRGKVNLRELLGAVKVVRQGTPQIVDSPQIVEGH